MTNGFDVCSCEAMRYHHSPFLMLMGAESSTQPTRCPHSWPRDRFHDFLWTPLDRQEIGGRRSIRHEPSLLPVLQRGKRYAKRRGKMMLRHPQGKADGFHVWQLNLGHAQPPHFLASSMPGGLLHALDQFLCKFSHVSCSLSVTQLFKI